MFVCLSHPRVTNLGVAGGGRRGGRERRLGWGRRGKVGRAGGRRGKVGGAGGRRDKVGEAGEGGTRWAGPRRVFWPFREK